MEGNGVMDESTKAREVRGGGGGNEARISAIS